MGRFPTSSNNVLDGKWIFPGWAGFETHASDARSEFPSDFHMQGPASAATMSQPTSPALPPNPTLKMNQLSFFNTFNSKLSLSTHPERKEHLPEEYLVRSC